MLETKVLSRKDAERLRGRLQFASGQLFGRGLRNHFRHLSEHIRSGRKSLSVDVVNALTSIKSHVEQNIPRRVSGKLSDYVHIYVDASFEPNGFSGLGGVMYASTGECLGFFSEKVDDDLLSRILAEDQKTVIQELEALALLMAVVTFKEWLSERRAVTFTDSESVRRAFLKSWSQKSELQSDPSCSLQVGRESTSSTLDRACAQPE